jgi:hypothetical protein
MMWVTGFLLLWLACGMGTIHFILWHIPTRAVAMYETGDEDAKRFVSDFVRRFTLATSRPGVLPCFYLTGALGGMALLLAIVVIELWGTEDAILRAASIASSSNSCFRRRP